MGVLFSRFRSKPTTKELLEEIQKEIAALEDYKRSTELQQKAVVRSLIFYSVLLYIIIAAFFLFYSYPVTTKDRIVYSIPFIIFPLLLYILKKFLHWYFLQKIRNNDENLSELRKRKKSMLEFAMETETYKVVKELLEKYDPVNHKKIFEARPAIEATPVSTSYRGSFGEMDLRRRNISPRGSPPMTVRPGQTLTMTSPPGFMTRFPPIMPGKPPTNPPYPPAFYQRGAPRFGVRPPAPPMPRPLLPRDRTLVDRLVDYLVGDGPSNRYALICKQCQSHNGMALKEEFEFVGFRCCYCFYFNPPRNQQPRLTLPAPPPTPAITEGTASPTSSSSEETEVDNASDAEPSAPIISPQENESMDEENESSEHRLSVSSSSEIHANLVEDLPFADSDDASTCEVLNNGANS